MIKVKFNDAMKKFLKENYGIKSNYEKKSCVYQKQRFNGI